MTSTHIRFESLPKTYARLIHFHMPRPIHDDVAYSNTVEIVDALALAEPSLNQDQRDYLELLTQLIEAYDAEIPDPKFSGIEMLRFLLSENGMTGDDLAILLGVDRSTAYRILKSTRKLTLEHVRRLSDRFRVSADLLIA